MLYAFLFCLSALLQSADAQVPAGSASYSRSVMDYGAKGDGLSDNTAAFQQALNEAAAASGGTVEVPAGRFRFEASLTLPANVTLKGTFHYAPAHAGIRDKKDSELPVFGSVLEPVGGAGSEEGSPFITLEGSSTLQGFCIHYPDQLPDAEAPTPYPWTIAMRGNNPALIDMELLNPYLGIDASRNQRALIRNIHGQPIRTGLFIDTIYDIGRVENVHWNPWWTINTPVYQWQKEHGTGFVFGKTDWHYVLNTFCFGYNVGYQFIKTENGATNGNFLGIGADDCHTALLVEDSEPMGILITNGEFVAFRGPNPSMIRVEKTHRGTVRFNNCAFWGPGCRNALIDGVGTVGFSNCTFMQWGHKQKDDKWVPADLPSIEVLGGSVVLSGNEFLENKPQIKLGKDVERAIVTDNLMNGKVRIECDAKKNRVHIHGNLGSPEDSGFRRSLHSRKDFRAMRLKEK